LARQEETSVDHVMTQEDVLARIPRTEPDGVKKGPCEHRNEAREGRNDAREGRNEAREGRNDAREDRNEAREGSNKAREGPNDAHEGSNKAREGPNDAHEGSNKAREGPNDAHEGSNKAREGPNDAREHRNDPRSLPNGRFSGRMQGNDPQSRDRAANAESKIAGDTLRSMQEGKGSRTADRVAERRAAHQVRDRPLVLDDPIALRVIHPEVARALREHPPKHETSLVGPYLRAFFVMRSRFAEDEMALAVGRGVRQYVVLGAGFDTFAYRNPFPELRVFEVDHPDTQAIKRQRLADAGIDAPASLTFVSIDFTTTALADALHSAGFDSSAPAFFSWLGVVPYLERPAIDATFRFIAALPQETEIAFDYAVPPETLAGPDA